MHSKASDDAIFDLYFMRLGAPRRLRPCVVVVSDSLALARAWSLVICHLLEVAAARRLGQILGHAASRTCA